MRGASAQRIRTGRPRGVCGEQLPAEATSAVASPHQATSGQLCHDPPVMEMSAEDFEQLVTDELDLLPDDMVDGLDNVVFVVEDKPEDGSDLFGIYDGVAQTERGQYGFGELPDRIVVFRKQHLLECDTLEELKDEVHTTLVHEIGHFYGIDDERLHELGWA